MPDLYEIADRFRADLLRAERRAATELVRAYGAAWQRIQARIDDLGQAMAAAITRGEEITPAWLFQFDRLVTLQREVEREIATFARFAEAAILQEQAAAVTAAQEHAGELARAGLGPPPPGASLAYEALNADAVRDLVGFLADGSPLRDLLDELGPEASRQVRETLIAGVATGQHPTAIARQIRQALGGNLVRALTIARTEMLRSYRTALLRSYQHNSRVISGWIWYSALGSRTCAFCWAMHGTVHRLEEHFASHPRCRCTPIPKTKSWRELGFAVPEELSAPPPEPGPDLFARLPEAQQRAILGPAKYAAYQAGAISLEDLRGFRRDPRWGRVGYERSLREILGAQRADAYARLARVAPVAGHLSRADRLILEAATGARRLSREELAEVLEHVARAGFDAGARERARGELAGMIWQSQELRGSTMLPPAERHFLKHVMLRREWPDGTVLDDYLASIEAVVRDPTSGVATRRYEGRAWQLTIVRRSGSVRGPADHAWVLVDYRVETGHWTTAYQFSEDPETELRRKAEEFRWLRRPRA
jgi:SPP1 gp7 family putative phage head morphogenesis protein